MAPGASQRDSCRIATRWVSAQKKTFKCFLYSPPTADEPSVLACSLKREFPQTEVRGNSLAPGAGLEPATSKLTASCSTIELPGITVCIITQILESGKNFMNFG